MKKIFLALLISTQVFAVTANKVWRIPSAGGPAAWGPINLASANAVTGLLPKGNLPSAGQQISSSCGNEVYDNGTGSFTDVNNLSVTITTTGRPVLIGTIPDGTGSQYSQWELVKVEPSSGSAIFNAALKLLRGGTAIQLSALQVSLNVTLGSGTGAIAYPASTVFAMDVPASGTYTYKVQGRGNGGSPASRVLCNYLSLFAMEL
jgi:hypothetical protein